jgi:hypothetical protein
LLREHAAYEDTLTSLYSFVGTRDKSRARGPRQANVVARAGLRRRASRTDGAEVLLLGIGRGLNKPGGKAGGGVLVGGVSRSKRLARAVVVCARGSMRVSELAAGEDTTARLTGNNFKSPQQTRGGEPIAALLSRGLLWRLACERRDGGVDGLEHLNQNLRIPVESLHHPVHDLRHVVEVYVEIHLG